MSNEFYIDAVILFFICAVFAYKLLEIFWPLFKDYKNLNREKILLHIMTECSPARNNSVFGTQKKTFLVIIINFIFTCFWLYTVTISPKIFLAFFVYLIIGFWFSRFLKFQKSNLAQLKLIDKITLRTFYAWLWPLYAFKK